MIKIHKMIYLITASFLMSCASDLKAVSFPVGTDPNAEIRSLESDLNGARKQQTQMTSPHYYSLAEEKLAKAKTMREKGKAPEKVLQSLGEARAALNEAQRIQSLNTPDLADLLSARESAISAGALTYNPQTLERIDHRLSNLTEGLERQAHKGQSKEPTSEDVRSDIKKDYVDLQLDSLKSRHLSKALSMINYAEKNRAATYSPKTLEEAKTKYRQAETMIHDHHTEEAMIAHAVAEANDAADKLVRVNQTARQAKGLSVEEIALNIESKKEALEKAEMSSEERAKMIKEKSEELATVKSQNEELKRKDEFDEVLTKMQKNFSPQEADVYRQGDKILIRLKSSNFISGRSEVVPGAYPVLGKVKDLITQVGAISLVVEGHTDSTGTEETNLKLSKKRADSVASYLTNNTNLEPAQIETEGYGFSQPVAPNNTSKGRAQNRRVDILVTPSTLR